MSNKVHHISLIMDGNNRWSKKKNINQFDAYIKGSNKLLEIADYIFSNYETKYITAFALSKNNLKRSTNKILILKNVIRYFLDNLNDISNFKFRIILKGSFSFLNRDLINKINNINSQNKNCKKSLIILLNYSGQNDILESVNKIIKSKNKFNKYNFEKNLLLSELPNPEILIRTGGYQRISNFMLYQLSFTDFFFLKKLWPDITKKDLKKIIDDYRGLVRKFGL